jgi:hypothetical protein
LLQEVNDSWVDHLRSKKPSTWNIFGSGDGTCSVWIFYDSSELDAVVPPQRTRLFLGDDSRNRNWRDFREAGHSTMQKPNKQAQHRRNMDHTNSDV